MVWQMMIQKGDENEPESKMPKSPADVFYLVNLFRVFTVMMSNIHLADEGLDKLKKNRNPRLAKLECLLYFRTTLAAFAIIRSWAIYDGQDMDFDLRAGHVLLAEEDGETFFTLFGKYINSIGEAYLDEDANRDYLNEILLATSLIVDIAQVLLGKRCAPDPRFQYAWSRFLHDMSRIQSLKKKEDRGRLLLHFQPTLDLIQRGLSTLATRLFEYESEFAKKLGDEPRHKPISPNRDRLKELVRIAVRLEKDGPVAREIREQQNILPDNRYDAIIPALAIWYHMPPSITHFIAVCGLLEQYAMLAVNGDDVDCDLPLRPYFADMLYELATHPKRTKDSTTLAELSFTPEEKASMAKAFGTMAMAFLRYRKVIKCKFGSDTTDPDAYDFFLSAVHDNLLDEMDDVEGLLFSKGAAKNNDDYNSAIFTLLSGALFRFSWLTPAKDEKLLKDAKIINPELLKVYKTGDRDRIGRVLEELQKKYLKHLPRISSRAKEADAVTEDTGRQLAETLNQIAGGPPEWEVWAEKVAKGEIKITGRFEFKDEGLTIVDKRQKVTWEKNIFGRAYQFIVQLIRAHSQKPSSPLPSTYDCSTRKNGKGRWVNDFHRGSPAQAFWDMEIGTKDKFCFIKPDHEVSKIKGKMRRCIKDGTNTTLK